MSERETNSSSVLILGFVEEEGRALYLCQRDETGASMLIRMKNGRRRSLSRIASLWMSVVTQRDCQFLVTKSRRASADGKIWDRFLDVPFVRLDSFALPPSSNDRSANV